MNSENDFKENDFNQQDNNMLNFQNQNMKQNDNTISQQPMNEPLINQQSFNSQPTSNQPFNSQPTSEQPVNQQPTNQFNMPNKANDESKKKIKIIGIVAVVLILLFGFKMLTGGNSSSHSGGYTVEYGETLKANEINGYFDFEVEVLSVEKNYRVNSFYYSGECYALKVSIKNNSTKDLEISPFIYFKLLDSSENVVATLSEGENATIDGGIKTKVDSGKTISGYLYFYDTDDSGNSTNIDDSNISKLQISVPKKMSSSGSTLTTDYNDYYIKLK